eukprot:8840000-Heterocapsa_arctica.AAC.1
MKLFLGWRFLQDAQVERVVVADVVRVVRVMAIRQPWNDSEGLNVHPPVTVGYTKVATLVIPRATLCRVAGLPALQDRLGEALVEVGVLICSQPPCLIIQLGPLQGRPCLLQME